MKHRLFIFGSLMSILFSTTSSLAEIAPSETELNIDVQDELASINDLIISLGGKIESNEDLTTFIYSLEDLSIIIDLSKGYSIVNDELAPYLLLPSETDSSVRNIVYFTPILKQDEIFVPIQFLERHFEVTFKNNIFNYYGDLDFITEEEIEEEEIEPIVEEEIIEEEWIEEMPAVTPTPTPTPKPETPQPTPQPTPEPETPSEPPVETPTPEEPPVETPTPEEPPVETPTPEETPVEPPVESPTPEEPQQV